VRYVSNRIGSASSHLASRKRKAEVVKKQAAKKARASMGCASLSRVVPPLPKVGSAKKVSVLKISQPKARPRP
jgi:hypothetical protein